MSCKKDSIDEVLLSNPCYHKDIMEDEKTSELLACDNLITFIVGGTKFQTAKSKFAYWPKTRLSKLIRAKSRKEKLELCDKYIVCKGATNVETYIFFRSGKSFDAILDKFWVLHHFIKLFRLHFKNFCHYIVL